MNPAQLVRAGRTALGVTKEAPPEDKRGTKHWTCSADLDGFCFSSQPISELVRLDDEICHFMLSGDHFCSSIQESDSLFVWKIICDVTITLIIRPSV